MFCDNCGEKIEIGSTFCDKCGSSVVPTKIAQFATTRQKQRRVSSRTTASLNPHALYIGVLLVIVLAAGYYFNASLANQQQKVDQIAQLASTSVQSANDRLVQAQSDLAAAKTQIKNTPIIAPPPVVSSKLTNAQIISKVKPAVVYIATNDGAGSGMILSTDGYILTNAHVVEDVSSATVTLSSGVSYFAIITGRNESLDVAVLKIGATNLPTVELGNSDNVVSGENVFALGFPFAASIKGEVSFTAGVISRRLNGNTYSYFESTAEIHPGNSGGPLVNSSGQVIGINSASYTPMVIDGIQLGESIKLAIPINLAKSQIVALKSGASVVTPTYTTPPATSPQPTYTPPPPDDQAIGEDYYRTKHTCIGLSGKQYEFCLTYAYNN
ncbi:MAG: Trypsin [Candidatus Giovannonibacteria bacterium GW2011_GWA2_45_21]|uniref:Trypsin n=1 Tax=Candidatus Giovannonibacteria bacterium GW2011_GWA2_45_21 TaxID=1618649 RepID=A0A0G1Q9E4_9BACT|nr:MAG: Trypsin [Candidatus Giovannonibacteria bacterium GW2011_GWA2_45_21]